MSVLFTDTMTVYNYFRDPETETENWQRTVIKGVQWTHNKNEVTTTNGVRTESKVESITIDFQRGYKNKPFLAFPEWRKLDSEEREGYWTLDPVNGQDVLVLGVSEQEISKQYRLSDLRNDFQYVATVTAVSDNRSRPRMKHIKVVGK